MKKTSRSLRALKLFLGISWWVTIAALGFSLVLTMAPPFIPMERIDGQELLFDLSYGTVSVTLDAAADPAASPIQAADPAWQDHNEASAIRLLLLYIVVLLSLALICIKLLRDIARSVGKGNPFIPINAKKISILGSILIFNGLFMNAFTFAVMQPAARLLNAEISEYPALLDIDFETLLAGMCLIVLAEVFRLGTQIQEEQSLTV
jgi:hypothetical protein